MKSDTNSVLLKGETDTMAETTDRIQCVRNRADRQSDTPKRKKGKNRTQTQRDQRTREFKSL